MEMPLVLHFSSRLEDPLPILTVEQMKKQMIGCRSTILNPMYLRELWFGLESPLMRQERLPDMGRLGMLRGQAGWFLPLR
jgi:hypothetical protein